jgi:hypothetical protein
MTKEEYTEERLEALEGGFMRLTSSLDVAFPTSNFQWLMTEYVRILKEINKEYVDSNNTPEKLP